MHAKEILRPAPEITWFLARIRGPLGLIQSLVQCEISDRTVAESTSRGVATCAKARKHGRKSFAKQPQSSIGKGIAAPPYPISCERRGWRKAVSTGTLRASRSLLSMRSPMLGKFHSMRASREQK